MELYGILEQWGSLYHILSIPEAFDLPCRAYKSYQDSLWGLCFIQIQSVCGGERKEFLMRQWWDLIRTNSSTDQHLSMIAAKWWTIDSETELAWKSKRILSLDKCVSDELGLNICIEICSLNVLLDWFNARRTEWFLKKNTRDNPQGLNPVSNDYRHLNLWFCTSAVWVYMILHSSDLEGHDCSTRWQMKGPCQSKDSMN